MNSRGLECTVKELPWGNFDFGCHKMPATTWINDNIIEQRKLQFSAMEKI